MSQLRRLANKSGGPGVDRVTDAVAVFFCGAFANEEITTGAKQTQGQREKLRETNGRFALFPDWSPATFDCPRP